jgi:tetratricopeptide (TPR) repeat protein
MGKHIALIMILAFAGPAFGSGFQDCVALAREYYNLGEMDKAEREFKRCVRINPQDTDVQLSLAGVLFRNSKLDEAKPFFLQALQSLPPDSEFIPYVHSRLGDIFLSENDFKKAKEHYSVTVKTDKTDANAIIGLARCYSKDEDWDTAAKLFRLGLKLEPSNPIADKGLRKVEPHIMSAEEILNELKERKAVSPDTIVLGAQDRDLFMQMRFAQEIGAVDFLKDKIKVIPNDYFVERITEWGTYRLLLTKKGFDAYKKLLTKDAIVFFSGKGYDVGKTFKLQSFEGKPLFEKGGVLTFEGMKVYAFALRGARRYYLPGDKVPKEMYGYLSETDRRVAKILDDGYEEISEPEFIWLSRETLCSEPTFRKNLDMVILEIDPNNNKLGRRYFVDKTGYRKDAGTLYSLIYSYRMGQKIDRNKFSAKRNFFGRGGYSTPTLCSSDGELAFIPKVKAVTGN